MTEVQKSMDMDMGMAIKMDRKGRKSLEKRKEKSGWPAGRKKQFR